MHNNNSSKCGEGFVSAEKCCYDRLWGSNHESTKDYSMKDVDNMCKGRKGCEEQNACDPEKFNAKLNQAGAGVNSSKKLMAATKKHESAKKKLEDARKREQEARRALQSAKKASSSSRTRANVKK